MLLLHCCCAAAAFSSLTAVSGGGAADAGAATASENEGDGVSLPRDTADGVLGDRPATPLALHLLQPFVSLALHEDADDGRRSVGDGMFLKPRLQSPARHLTAVAVAAGVDMHSPPRRSPASVHGNSSRSRTSSVSKEGGVGCGGGNRQAAARGCREDGVDAHAGAASSSSGSTVDVPHSTSGPCSNRESQCSSPVVPTGSTAQQLQELYVDVARSHADNDKQWDSLFSKLTHMRRTQQLEQQALLRRVEAVMSTMQPVAAAGADLGGGPL